METKKLVYFCHYPEKWSETKLLLHDFVSSVLASHLQTSQSAHVKSTIHLCGVQSQKSYPSFYSLFLLKQKSTESCLEIFTFKNTSDTWQDVGP